MRFIVAMMSFADQAEQFVRDFNDRLHRIFGKRTDMMVQLINYLLIVLGISSPLLLWLARAPFPVHIIVLVLLLIYLVVFSFYPSLRIYPTLRLRVLGNGSDHIHAFFVTGTVCLLIEGAVLWAAFSGKIPPEPAVEFSVVFSWWNW